MDPRIAEGVKLVPELQRELHDAIEEGRSARMYINQLETIIAALTAAGEMAGERQGWKLVPVEPTQEMLDQAKLTIPMSVDFCEADIEDIYLMMVTAAPAAPVAPASVEDVEKAAMAAWNEESLRATGRSRLCLWSDIGVGEQEKWRGIAKSVLAAIGRT